MLECKTLVWYGNSSSMMTLDAARMQRPVPNMTLIIVAATIITAAIISSGSAVHDANSTPQYNTAWGASEPPAYVESVTFAKQANQIAGVDSLISGGIDMYYTPITMTEPQRVRDAGHDIYESFGGSVYALHVNPVNDTTNGFNMFADRDARYALNFMLDRGRIVESLFGSGFPMISALPTTHPDYLHVRNSVASLGIIHDIARAERMIAHSLMSAGATKDSSGMWHHGGEPVTITIFIRDDDVIRHHIGDDLADAFEAMGIAVKREYGNLDDAFTAVYRTDPADQTWHLYTAAWANGGPPPDFDDARLGEYYAPWRGELPGYGIEGFWRYENSTLDTATLRLAFGLYGSFEERAHLVNHANYLGIQESVNVFVGSSYESYAVRDGITGVINPAYVGITTRYTPLNVQLPANDASLEIGVRHVSQTPWNVIGGFRDVYSSDVWDLLHDKSFVRNPHNSDLLNNRNVYVSLEIADSNGSIRVHPDAVSWNTSANAWTPASRTEALNKYTFDLVFSNWHHGQSMDINDIMYQIVSAEERRAEASAAPITNLETIRIVDSDTIEVYTYNRFVDVYSAIIAASQWASVPWEIHFAMKQVVDSGQADWRFGAARANSGNWIDMLDPEDVALARGMLAEFRDASSEHHVPYFLYHSSNPEYTTARYDAAIAWIDSRGHMAVGNGPFHLTGDIVRSSDDDGRTITSITLERFDDPSYPYARGYWSGFEDFEPLLGSIAIGSLAPITGSAHIYGQETRAASNLAIADFNEYLKSRGEKWTLETVQYDTRSDPAGALSALESLDGMGIKLVNGPVIDVATDEVRRYADTNGMIMMSCCSSIPSNAIAGDSLFRLLPDQRAHAAQITELVVEHSIVDPTHVIPVGIDNPWAVELLNAAKPGFEGADMTYMDIITYTPDGIPAGVDAVAEAVGELHRQGREKSDIIIVYVGFGEGPEFLREASAYDMLGDVRWFGADQNTASPNIGDDPVAAAFASKVRFTVVQPSVSESNYVVKMIHEELAKQGITPSAYASYAYDAVWVLGLAMLEAQSSDPADVYPEIRPAAKRYVGAIGSTELNQNGDLRDGTYQSWLFAGDGAGQGWIKYSSDVDPDTRDIADPSLDAGDMTHTDGTDMADADPGAVDMADTDGTDMADAGYGAKKTCR